MSAANELLSEDLGPLKDDSNLSGITLFILLHLFPSTPFNGNRWEELQNPDPSIQLFARQDESKNGLVPNARAELVSGAIAFLIQHFAMRRNAVSLTPNLLERYIRLVPTLTIELPEQQAQTAFNLQRWEELLADRELAKVEGRIETDRHGHIIMSPPPAPNHGSYQTLIAHLLITFMRNGRVLTECPISTADGVKAADVAWASPSCMRKLGNRVCFPEAPEICVEVLSPSNTQAEIQEKTALYFDAGAKEVWICADSGQMKFLGPTARQAMPRSALCPQFPAQVQLR